MAEAISGLQAQLPGTVITRSSPIQTAQDLVTYSWSLGPAGGSTVVTGRDVLIIRNDSITSVYVLIDAPGYARLDLPEHTVEKVHENGTPPCNSAY